MCAHMRVSVFTGLRSTVTTVTPWSRPAPRPGRPSPVRQTCSLPRRGPAPSAHVPEALPAGHSGDTSPWGSSRPGFLWSGRVTAAPRDPQGAGVVGLLWKETPHREEMHPKSNGLGLRRRPDCHFMKCLPTPRGRKESDMTEQLN